MTKTVEQRLAMMNKAVEHANGLGINAESARIARDAAVRISEYATEMSQSRGR